MNYELQQKVNTSTSISIKSQKPTLRQAQCDKKQNPKDWLRRTTLLGFADSFEKIKIREAITKSKKPIPLLLLLLLFSCKTPLQIANVETQKNISINADLKENESFSKIIEPYKNKLESEMNTKISHTEIELNKVGDNPNLGNLLADYTFEGAENWAKQNGISNVNAAVINIGGIRTIIAAGDILVKHIYEVMPFENEVVIVKMKGTDMNGLFDYYAKTQKNNPVSHLVIETDKGVISKELINGEPLNLNKIYYIATSDYLATGGDDMTFFAKGETISTGIKMRDLFIEKFKENPEIKVPNDVRLVFIK
ncbi:MAG: 5'-nucleotidase C-terminal domain-containing protein [Flavobacteriaceae bacterium]|jgi:2',3'-cyclic-nucleotide 2'-phosphodiesterase (5'-nucleotidase family)|nr:5'-nucleotidase C-terminal domain-containing protein [Flavobacteriaceae bacterium]